MPAPRLTIPPRVTVVLVPPEGHDTAAAARRFLDALDPHWRTKLRYGPAAKAAS